MQAPPPVSDLLRRSATMAANVRGLLANDHANWRWRPAPGEWSLTEVACHLRDVEIEVHQARYEALLAAENAFLPGVVADEWAGQRHYQEQDCQSAIGAFLAARDSTLEMLADLPPAVWQRQGRHAFFGPTSLHELLYLAVQHDEIHWGQIERLLQGQLPEVPGTC